MIAKPKKVIISIKPEYALKMISGEKTIEKNTNAKYKGQSFAKRA